MIREASLVETKPMQQPFFRDTALRTLANQTDHQSALLFQATRRCACFGFLMALEYIRKFADTTHLSRERRLQRIGFVQPHVDQEADGVRRRNLLKVSTPKLRREGLLSSGYIHLAYKLAPLNTAPQASSPATSVDSRSWSGLCPTLI